MSQQFVIAYDLGTSGVKVALVSLTGDVLATATATYPLYVPHENWAEQNPELYWSGVCQVTKAVFAESGNSPSDAAGLAFGTLWKGIIPVDSQGKVLRHSILWLDRRAVDQTNRLNEHFGPDTFSSGDYWPKLLWLRENCPEIYEKADVIFEVNSFVKWKATGQRAMDISNSFVRSFDPTLQKIYDDILSFGGLALGKFPPTVGSCDLVGHVTESAAVEMGLVPGIPVFGGCGDIPAIAIGSGCSDLEDIHIYFGTSGWIGYCLPHSAEELYLSPFDEVRDIHINGMNAIGLALNWAVDRFYSDEKKQLGDGVYQLINRELAQISPCCEGLVSTPWFYGGIPPLLSPQDGGSFWNLGPQHDRRHMTRAILEGVCYTLRMGAVYRRDEKGYPWPQVLHAVGGGAASDVWMQMLADIMNVPVYVPRSPPPRRSHWRRLLCPYRPGALQGLQHCQGIHGV